MKSIQIIYQDKNFIAINKPAGMLTHSVSGIRYQVSGGESLIEKLIKKFPEIKSVGDEPETRPGIVHRLDKDTSGIILIARNQKYFEYLKNLFQTGQIKKTYLALVKGRLKEESGIIKKSISLKPGTTKRTVYKGKMEKPAVTEYRLLRTCEVLRQSKDLRSPRIEYFSLLEVFPKTGRTHQIRVHLASIGHPVVGDALYGQKENPLGLTRQFLHAQSLEFNLETGKRIRLEAELPEELKNVLTKFKS